jgi:AbrB family looped-hinge helix DNA binding protein
MFTVRKLGNSRLSKKFQITIPKEVRKVLQITSSDLIVFISDPKGVLIKRGEIRVAD